MKSRFSICIATITIFAGLASSVPLAAQQKKGHKHHHYKLIDLGTFGGPQSRIDYAVPLNNAGMVTGSADTPNANPYYGNDNPTFFSDPYIEHTFGWKDDVLTDLGSLPGGGISQPNCMNQRGDTAGNASNDVIDPMGGWPESRAVLYKDGQIFDLGTLDGGSESAATCINNRNVVIGFAGDTVPDPFSLVWGTQTHAFRWMKWDGMQDIGTLGGPDVVPFVINDAGQISGISYTNSIPNPTTGLPTLDPFLWENGHMTDLGGLGGSASDLFAEGGAMNSHGQVVGNSNLAGDVYFHPFLWTKPGPMQDLGTLGGNLGSAGPIDDEGEIAGWATTAGDQNLFAFFWKDNKMTTIGSVDGDPCSVAAFVRHGQVVGASWDCTPNYLHAFLWENGSIVDLNTLVPPGTGVQLTVADYINERGEITANGLLSNGNNHAFLLIPCDDGHPGVEGCEYTLVDTSEALPTTRAVCEAIGVIPPPALSRRNNPVRFPGRAFGPRN